MSVTLCMSRALESHQPHGESADLQGWEWYYLASLLRKQKNMFHPQLGAISQVKWNPAGRLVAIAGDSGVKIYEPTSRQVVHFIAGHALRGMEFRWLALGYCDDRTTEGRC